jgi:hypothetical protein
MSQQNYPIDEPEYLDVKEVKQYWKHLLNDTDSLSELEAARDLLVPIDYLES